jgi:hypothetical protein
MVPSLDEIEIGIFSMNGGQAYRLTAKNPAAKNPAADNPAADNPASGGQGV